MRKTFWECACRRCGPSNSTSADYSLLATPFWIDDLVTCLKEVVNYRIRLHVYRERAARMQSRRPAHQPSVSNLFDKVLIPDAKRNIARIPDFPLGCWAGCGGDFEDR